MGSRSKARECALQALYQLDTSGGNASEVLLGIWSHFDPVDEETKRFAEALVRGAQREQEVIDEVIRRSSTNWKIERMARVDRNVLRLAVYEILRRAEADGISTDAAARRIALARIEGASAPSGA